MDHPESDPNSEPELVEGEPAPDGPHTFDADADEVDIDPDDDEAFARQQWGLGNKRVGVLLYKGTYFRLEEPDHDEEVALLGTPLADAPLLFQRALDILVTAPDLEEKELTPTERGMLADAALDWYGLKSKLSKGVAEQAFGDPDTDGSE